MTKTHSLEGAISFTWVSNGLVYFLCPGCGRWMGEDRLDRWLTQECTGEVLHGDYSYWLDDLEVHVKAGRATYLNPGSNAFIITALY